MEIAFYLKIPLYELLDKMSFLEFNLWVQYFDQRPVGWQEDDRTYKVLRALGVKAGAGELFSSLSRMTENTKKKAAIPGKGSFLHEAMLNAKGGDKLDLLQEI